MPELYVLLGLMIIGSLIALQIKDLFSSIVIIGVVGLCLSVGFVFLEAPDLAIMQLIVEILLVVILIKATVAVDHRAFKIKRRDYVLKVVVIVCIAVFLLSGFFVINKLPIFGKPLLRTTQTYLSNAANNSQITNIVSSVMLDYRLFDTFGCILAIFVAVVGVLSLTQQMTKHK